MAQGGKLKTKGTSSGRVIKKGQGKKGKKSGGRRRGAPSQQIRKLRDKKVTKMLHANIETLVAAKAIRNEGSLKMRDLKTKGKQQMKLEDANKEKKGRTKEDAQETQLKNAIKKLNKG